jgi:phage-related minor tail protein
MADSLGHLTASLGLDTSSLAAGVSSAKAALGGLAGPVGIAVAGAVALGGALFAVGEKFKTAYNQIQVGTGATGAALKGLEGSFKAVLAGTAGSFDQVAAAITGVSQRTGLTGAALEDFAKKEVTLGRITKTDVGENVKATTALFGLYGIAASEQSGKLDVLFKASQVAGVSIGELTSQVQAATPVAKALGMTFDQTAALTANLTAAGLPASKVMQGLGKEFTAAAKAGKDPLSVIKDIEEQIKKAPNDTAAAEIAFQKFGVRAGPQLAAALREGRFDLTKTLAQITSGKDGILATGAAVSTLGGKFQHLKNEALVALEPIGTGLYNLANKGLGQFIKGIEELGPKVAAGFATVKGIVTKAWDDLVGGFQNPDAGIGKGVGGLEATFLRTGQVIRKAFDDIKAAVTETMTALQPVFDFIEAHAQPILIGLGVAIAALVSPFATLAFGLVYAYSRFEAFRDVVDAVAKFLTGTVVPAVVAFAGYVRDQFGHLVDYLVGIWPQVSEAIGHVMVVLKDIFGPALLVIRQLWRDWGQSILDIVGAMWVEVQAVISAAIRIVRDVIQVVLALINGDWGKAWNALKDIVATVLGLIKTTVQTELTTLKGIVQGVMNDIKAVFSIAWDGIKDVARTALRAIVDFFLQAAIDIVGAADHAFGWIPGIGGKLNEAHQKLVDFKNRVNGTLDEVANNPIRPNVDTSEAEAKIANLKASIRSLGSAVNNAPVQDTGGNNAGGSYSDSNSGGAATPPPADTGGAPADAMGGIIGMAMGGLRRAAAGIGFKTNRPTLVGEGNPAFPEFVIATDPLYRVRNLGLLSQANQALGVSAGGAGGTSAPIDYQALAAAIAPALAAAVAANPIRASVSANDVTAGQHYAGRGLR